MNVSIGSDSGGVVIRTVSHQKDYFGYPVFSQIGLDRLILFNVDLKRDQLETRVATLELMLVAERARPKPHEDKIAKLDLDLKAAKAILEKYNREHPP